MSTGATRQQIDAAVGRYLNGAKGQANPSATKQNRMYAKRHIETVAACLVPDGWRLADAATVAAMRHLIDAWSEFAAVPGPWVELEVVRAWLDAADAGGGDGNG